MAPVAAGVHAPHVSAVPDTVALALAAQARLTVGVWPVQVASPAPQFESPPGFAINPRSAARYRERLEFFSATLQQAGLKAELPQGGFYLWVPAPEGDAWALTERLARDAGVLVSPGDFYGEPGAGHVRVALVQPLEKLELVARRLGSGRS